MIELQNPAWSGHRIACDHLETGIVVRALAIWQRCRKGRLMPRREDMTPRDFAGLLRHAALLKVVDEGQDYEFRMVGELHAEVHQLSVLGKRLPALDEFSPGYGAALKAVCKRVCDHARPSALRGWLGSRTNPHGSVQHESVFLPFGKGPKTDHILIVSVYMRGDGLSRPPNRTR